jgi:hypothetical protein
LPSLYHDQTLLKRSRSYACDMVVFVCPIRRKRLSDQPVEDKECNQDYE